MSHEPMTAGAVQKKSKIYGLSMTAVMAAVTCVLAPMSIPIGPVPISFTNLAIYLSLYLLGWKRGTVSYLVYVLIGMVGVPVFSGFTGGSLTAEGKLRWCPTVLRWDAGGAGCIIWRDLAPGLAYSLMADTGASEDALSDMAALVFKPAQEES